MSTKCHDCQEEHNYHRLVDWDGNLVGHLCDDCYAECETEESLAILELERIAYA